MSTEISLKELIASGAHFGHQSRRWNPKMKPFLYGTKDGVHVFDLTKTKEKLEEALNFLKEVAAQGKTILFVGTKRQAKEKIREVSRATDSFYVNERWLGGTITNFDQIKKSCRKLTDLKRAMEAGEYKDHTKHERMLIQREIDRLERFFGGIVGMEKIPDVLVVVDIKNEKTAIKEAREREIETIGVVDSNTDPTLVDYPIPMNDDASRAIDYLLELMKEAIMEGKKKISKKLNSKS